VLYELARNHDLVLYDDDQLKYAASYASAKELGNLLFITKAGRGKIDLLVAMSNALAGFLTPVDVYEIVEFPRIPIDVRY